MKNAVHFTICIFIDLLGFEIVLETFMEKSLSYKYFTTVKSIENHRHRDLQISTMGVRSQLGKNIIIKSETIPCVMEIESSHTLSVCLSIHLSVYHLSYLYLSSISLSIYLSIMNLSFYLLFICLYMCKLQMYKRYIPCANRKSSSTVILMKIGKYFMELIVNMVTYYNN